MNCKERENCIRVSSRVYFVNCKERENRVRVPFAN